MAQVYADSELMTNLVSAVPVPGGSYFRLILDEDRRPFVISISNAPIPRLQSIRHGKSNNSDIEDISPCLSIPESSRVLTFDVQQAANLKVFLCVGVLADDGATKLVITQPFLPQFLKRDSVLPLISGNHDVGKIEKIWMTPMLDDPNIPVNFPAIYITHRSLDQLSSWGSDITRIDVAPNGYEWLPAKNEQTPENTSGILDVAPAVSFYGKGLYVLYKSGGVSKLYARFLYPDADAKDGSKKSFVTSLKCASDARCIASSFELGKDGAYSSLLVGSPEGIRYLTPSQAVKKTEAGNLITGRGTLLNNIRSLRVAQDGKYSTAWFTNMRGELGYIRTQNNDFSKGQSALILPEDRVRSFAVCTSSPSVSNGNVAWQMLVSNDSLGNLQLLQQASDTGIWKPEPFYVPSNTDNYEVESYTITFRVQDNEAMPVSAGKAFIASASAVEATLNGLSCTLTPDGDWYDMDDSGSLDFIVPTKSLGAQSLTMSKVKGSSGEMIQIDPLIHDPSAKPMKEMHEKLASFEDADHLRKAETKLGQPLFSGSPGTAELSGALACFNTLKAAHASLPRDGSSGLVKGFKRAEAVAEAVYIGAQELLMDAWQWMKEKVHQAVDWVVDTAGDLSSLFPSLLEANETSGKVWKFVCTLGGQVWHFTLDCVEKICEAATWVWEKIKVGWQKLKDFVGFVFNWGDIKETKVTISTLITASIGAASDKVRDIEQKVDVFFDGLDQKIDEFGAVGPTKISADQKEKSLTSQACNGTGASWAQERLKNGGATSSTEVEAVDGDSEATTTWSSVFQPAMSKLEKEVTKVSGDIAQLFKREGAISGDDLINVSKGVLKTALSVVRGLVSSILRLVQKLCSEIIKVGNKAIKIPIFSSLWRKISGSELTLFDAISLIIAIPTTIMAKIVTGEKPPRVQGLDRKVVKKLIDGDETVDQQTSYQFDVLKAEIALGLVVSKGTWNLIKLVYKGASKGTEAALKATMSGPGAFFSVMGIVFDMLGSIASIPTERGLPGGEFRNWISAISFYRGCCNLVVFMAGGGAAAEKALIVLDVVSSLAQFGLYMAVFDAEYKAVQWKDYDSDKITVSVTECALNLVSGIGYSTAAFFKMEQPQVSGVGLVVMQGGLAGLTVLQAAKFRVQYDQKKRTRFISLAC